MSGMIYADIKVAPQRRLVDVSTAKSVVLNLFLNEEISMLMKSKINGKEGSVYLVHFAKRKELGINKTAQNRSRIKVCNFSGEIFFINLL